MTIGTPYNVNMLFADSLVEKSGGECLVRSNCFVAYRAHSCYSGFAFGVAVRAALDCHELVRNFHGAVYLGNKLFAYKKLGLAHRAFNRLHVRCLFFAGGGQFTVRVHYKNGGKEGNYYY